MPEKQPQVQDAVPVRDGRSQRWDALGVVVASLVGLLALLVSGYTAYVQRQQVRAQVWPHLWVAYQDLEHQLTVFNKGVGPAIVRSVRVSVDGKPQTEWNHVLAALKLPMTDYGHSTISGTVLSPGDALSILVFPDAQSHSRFREAMSARGLISICYCSTLDECWSFEDRRRPAKPSVQPVDECPSLPVAEGFRD